MFDKLFGKMDFQDLIESNQVVRHKHSGTQTEGHLNGTGNATSLFVTWPSASG